MLRELQFCVLIGIIFLFRFKMKEKAETHRHMFWGVKQSKNKRKGYPDNKNFALYGCLIFKISYLNIYIP